MSKPEKAAVEPEKPSASEKPSWKPAPPAKEESPAKEVDYVAQAQSAAEQAAKAAEAARTATTVEEKQNLADAAAEAAAQALAAAKAAQLAAASAAEAQESSEPATTVDAAGGRDSAPRPLAGVADSSGGELPSSEQTAELDPSEIEFLNPPAPPMSPSPAMSPPPAPVTEQPDIPEDDWGADYDDDLGLERPAGGGGTRIMGIIMAVLLGLAVLFFLFVAARNDFNFNRDFGTMVSVALSGGSAGVQEMDVVRAQPRVVHLKSGESVLWVHASVRNESFGTKTNVKVEASIVGSKNEVVTKTALPCGLSLTEEELAETTKSVLAKQYRDLESRALTVAAETEMPCSVVFLTGSSLYQPTTHDIQVVVIQADATTSGQ